MADGKPKFLEIDSKIIENRLTFEECKPAGLEECKLLFGINDAGDDLKAPWKLVTPQPGFCVKTFDDEGKKVFVNICTLEEVPEPKDIDAETLLRLIETQDASDYRVPLSLQNPRDQLDKSNNPAVCYDVAINPRFLSKVLSEPAFKIFLLQVTFDGLKDKFDVDLKIDNYVILNRAKCMGSLTPHRIRTTASPQPPPSSKPLVQEIPSKFSVKIVPKSENTSYEHRFAKVRREGKEFLYGEIFIPDALMSKDISLDIGSDRIIVENSRTGRILDVCLPEKIDSRRSSSEFSTATKTLHILSACAV